MIGFNPYITFEGTCEEALHFYKTCFGGDIVFIQYYREMPQARGSAELLNKVMHSEFKAGPVHFMACDISGAGASVKGNFNVTFGDPREQKHVFEKLVAGGSIDVALEKTYWQNIFGMVTDRYGVHWMLNCEANSGPIV